MSVKDAVLGLASNVMQQWGPGAKAVQRAEDPEDSFEYMVVTDFGRRIHADYHPAAAIHTTTLLPGKTPNAPYLDTTTIKGPCDAIIVPALTGQALASPGKNVEFEVWLNDRDQGKERPYGRSRGGVWTPPGVLHKELEERIKAGFGATNEQQFGTVITRAIPVDFSKIDRVYLRFNTPSAPDQAVVRVLNLLQTQESAEKMKAARNKRQSQAPYE